MNQVELAHFEVKRQADVANLVEYATRLDHDGMNVSFWWSLSLFTDNKTATESAWRSMPRIDSMFFPGGDGGVSKSLNKCIIYSKSVHITVFATRTARAYGEL